MKSRTALLLLSTFLLASCSGVHKYVAASHPNGKPEVIVYMKGKGEDAVKVMEKVYYPNGQMEYVGRFENGVENGVWEYFYENGTRKYLETWVAGVEDGIHYDYAPDGQVYRELYYDHGRLVKEIDRSKE